MLSLNNLEAETNKTCARREQLKRRRSRQLSQQAETITAEAPAQRHGHRKDMCTSLGRSALERGRRAQGLQPRRPRRGSGARPLSRSVPAVKHVRRDPRRGARGHEVVCGAQCRRSAGARQGPAAVTASGLESAAERRPATAYEGVRPGRCPAASVTSRQHPDFPNLNVTAATTARPREGGPGPEQADVPCWP